MKSPVVQAMPQTETMAVGKDPAEVKAMAAAEVMAMLQVMIGMKVMAVTESVSEHGTMRKKWVPVRAMAEVAEPVTEDDDRSPSPGRC